MLYFINIIYNIIYKIYIINIIHVINIIYDYNFP